MAKSFIDFVPSQIQAPQFNVTLDGQIFTALITWSLFAQRYYITLTALDGTLILTEALVGSPIPIAISAIAWANGRVTVTTANPHGIPFGRSAILTIDGVTPAAFNGDMQVLVTGRNTFTYPLAVNPGPATILGAVEKNVNLVAGFFTSKLIFRQPNNQFEVT
jgi:hypothetical protein